MNCPRCTLPDAESFGYEPNILYRCRQCLFEWGAGMRMLLERIGGIEASLAKAHVTSRKDYVELSKIEARVERLERTIVTITEVVAMTRRDSMAKDTLWDAIVAIRQDLAEMDRERGK